MRIVFSILFLLTMKFLYAVSVGNISIPSLLQEGVLFSDENWFNFRVGYEHSYIVDRKLRFAKRLQKQGFSMEKVKGQMNLASLALNIMERFDAYGKFGESYYSPTFYQNNILYELQSSYGGYYYGGFRLVLWEVKDTSFGFEGGYGFFRSGTKFFYENQFPIDGVDFGFFSREWYINAGASHKMGCFIPYFAVSVCDIKAKIKRTHFFNKKQLRLDDREKTGYFLGVSFTRSSFFFLNAEAHFYNERSYSISGAMRF